MFMFKNNPLVSIKQNRIRLFFLKIQKNLKQMGHITTDDKSLKSMPCTGKNWVMTTFWNNKVIWRHFVFRDKNSAVNFRIKHVQKSLINFVLYLRVTVKMAPSI